MINQRASDTFRHPKLHRVHLFVVLSENEYILVIPQVMTYQSGLVVMVTEQSTVKSHVPLKAVVLLTTKQFAEAEKMNFFIFVYTGVEVKFEFQCQLN